MKEELEWLGISTRNMTEEQIQLEYTYANQIMIAKIKETNENIKNLKQEINEKLVLLEKMRKEHE